MTTREMNTTSTPRVMILIVCESLVLYLRSFIPTLRGRGRGQVPSTTAEYKYEVTTREVESRQHEEAQGGGDEYRRVSRVMMMVMKSAELVGSLSLLSQPSGAGGEATAGD